MKLEDKDVAVSERLLAVFFSVFFSSTLTPDSLVPFSWASRGRFGPLEFLFSWSPHLEVH